MESKFNISSKIVEFLKLGGKGLSADMLLCSVKLFVYVFPILMIFQKLHF